MINVYQITSLPAWALVDTLSPDTYLLVRSIGEIEKTREKNKEYNKIHKDLPDSVKDELKSLGAKKLIDRVELHMKLGDFLLDLYLNCCEVPKAPMAKKKWKQAISSYSSQLNKDEFEIPSEVAEKAKEVLNDEEKWENLKVTCWVEKGEDKVKLFLTSKGLGQFQVILDAAVGALE